MTKHILISALLTLLLFSCLPEDKKSDSNESDDPPPDITQPKELESVWSVSNNAWTINLTNATTDGVAFSMSIVMAGGSTCACDLEFDGTESAGTCTVATPCTYIPGAGTSDPGCGNFGMCGSGGYTMDGTNFRFNNGATYH